VVSGRGRQAYKDLARNVVIRRAWAARARGSCQFGWLSEQLWWIGRGKRASVTGKLIWRTTAGRPVLISCLPRPDVLPSSIFSTLSQPPTRNRSAFRRHSHHHTFYPSSFTTNSHSTKMTGGKSGGKASGAKSSAQSYVFLTLPFTRDCSIAPSPSGVYICNRIRLTRLLL
jgi:hypothetical protein